MTTRIRTLAGAALAALALSLAACTGSSDGGDADTADYQAESGGGAAGPPVPAEAPGAQGRGAAGADGGSGVNRTVVTVRAVIRTGEVAVTNNDLDGARDELDTVLVSLGGSIDSEETQHDRSGRIERSTITVRVPVDRFEDAMSALQGLGNVQHADSSSKDVTTQVIDVAERVETLERSLDRLQSFQDDAASIDDLVRYEQEITQREAELQSLKSQQSYLRDQTSMSTITLYLSRPDKYVPPPDSLEDAGFLTGLKSGWNALADTVVVVLTVVGAVLPFAAVLALIGVPTWLLVRRSLRARVGSAPSGSAPPLE